MQGKVEERKLVQHIKNGKADYPKIKQLLIPLDDLDAIIAIICSKGKIAYINTAGCDLLGADHLSLVGKNWGDNFSLESQRQQKQQSFQKFIDANINPCRSNNPILQTVSGDGARVDWAHSFVKSRQNNAVVACFSIGKVKAPDLIQPTPSSLTSREINVLTYFSHGYNAKEIAQKLNIQPKTVHAHKKNIFHKMKFTSHRQMLSFAVKNELLSLSDLISD